MQMTSAGGLREKIYLKLVSTIKSKTISKAYFENITHSVNIITNDIIILYHLKITLNFKSFQFLQYFKKIKYSSCK